MGARPHGAQALLSHPWFRGITAERLLHKQVAAPWLPHLNGPEETPPSPPSPGLVHMARGHACGRQTLGDSTAELDMYSEWGEPATLQVSGTAPLDVVDLTAHALKASSLEAQREGGHDVEQGQSEAPAEHGELASVPPTPFSSGGPANPWTSPSSPLDLPSGIDELDDARQDMRSVDGKARQAALNGFNQLQAGHRRSP